MRYYHGTFDPLTVGTVLSGRGAAYVDDWSTSDFYTALEHHRPASSLAHHDAVFMVGDPDDIDAAGGGTEWCAEVLPQGMVERHDLGWCTRISELLGDGAGVTDESVRQAAEAYWLGAPHPDHPLWEHLAPRAVVVRVGLFEAFEAEPPEAAPAIRPSSAGR